ncbi:NO-binding membrane sensor protein with MHYT domain [Luteibacter rhizovicinus]|uniref:NO-binding membrane sensor protein with MHYT domain n=1 Tax=Luteibacter rhizovicinus TaxID=242606 RepID=A0A4R3YKE8_9GAMM|nr:MHYT domain-containing protein [Luteibacter rhizovicinus]TCV92720.1 NO-binding membrane sensor protein with MHYT domain [Luteibacter rhizovicinus]
MDKHYDILLVVYSFVIASLTGYCGIEMTSRVRRATENKWVWIGAAAVAFGTGVWGMHFMGMVALMLPVPVTFDTGITFASWAVAVLVSGIGFYVIRNGVRVGSWLLASALMATGVCLMHYGGMYAMQMGDGLTYRPVLFWISAAIAFGASAAALLIMTWLRDSERWPGILARLGAAMVMGLAVTGMHYTGMAAAIFGPGAYCSPANGLSNAATILGLVIGATAVVSISQWSALLR